MQISAIYGILFSRRTLVASFRRVSRPHLVCCCLLVAIPKCRRTGYAVRPSLQVTACPRAPFFCFKCKPLHNNPSSVSNASLCIITDCRDVFTVQQTSNVTGTWTWPLDECKCFSSRDGIIGRCARSQPRVIPAWPLASVCGGDGVTYDSADSACARGTFPLHGGPCGACSSRHDIDIYNATRNNLTTTTTSCALQLLYHGYIVLFVRHAS